MSAFKTFDDGSKGVLTRDRQIEFVFIELYATRFHLFSLRELLTSLGKPGERLTDVEVRQSKYSLLSIYQILSRFQFNQMLEGAPVDPKGLLDYSAFTKLIKRGNDEE